MASATRLGVVFDHFVGEVGRGEALALGGALACPSSALVHAASLHDRDGGGS